MQKSQTTSTDGYPHENRMESEGKVEVCSIPCGETEERDGVPQLINKVVSRNNLNAAYKAVKANKGSAGVDGMEVGELYGYLIAHGEEITQQIREGSYEPHPVKRVEVDKDDGSKRKLGVPTTVDRLVQQAILQAMEPVVDPTFSDASFGFRPKRSAHDAMRQAKQYYEEGYRFVVDMDMEQYFDTVNHDKLMYHVGEHIQDPIVLRLIRKFLTSGVSIDGTVYPTEVGCPQGGNLSPILSNIYLDQLDKELEKRGHRFIRYADDANIYVKTPKAGNRVMKSITTFLEGKLKLTVNRQKSEVGKPTQRKFLGFCIHTTGKGVGFRPHHKSKKKFEKKLRNLTKRNRNGNIRQIIREVNEVTVGWITYYGISYMKGYIHSVNQWIRRRIRQIIWKRWKKVKTRYRSLIKLNVPQQKAWEWANTRKGHWRIACSHILHRAINNKTLEKVGLKDLDQLLEKAHSNY